MSDPFCWAMHAVRELPTYVKGRTALVGDAVRQMSLVTTLHMERFEYVC